MKYFELNKEEEAIEKELASGKLRSVSDVEKEKKRIRSYVSSSLKKTRTINIRLSESDLLKLKAKALAEGIPYQTYFTSIVHKSLAR
jgi:predicted DNA binding CopG/RHH family protein